MPFLVAEVDAEVDDSEEIITCVVENGHRNINLETYLEHRWPNFEWNHLILKCKQSMKHLCTSYTDLGNVVRILSTSHMGLSDV